MMFKFIIWIWFVQLSLSEDDSKWVWKGKGRNVDVNVDIVSKPRYEIVEDDVEDFVPDFQRPGKPIGIDQGPGFPNRPGPQRPFIPEPSYRPGDTEIFHTPELEGSFHPNNNGPGILTGPVPSWVREKPFKQFDTCKCAEKFNCNTPGISYGHCDVGKQYCCYHSKRPDALGSPLPSRPIHSPENGVLVGPGGPANYPIRPNRPYYSRPPGYGGNGILAGPGGPIGFNGRPPSGGNFHSSEFGVLVGPGARPGQNGFGYGRNAKTD